MCKQVENLNPTTYYIFELITFKAYIISVGTPGQSATVLKMELRYDCTWELIFFYLSKTTQ